MVLNEFATIILPIAFSWISNPQQQQKQQQEQKLPLHKLFNNPDLLYEKNGLETIFK